MCVSLILGGTVGGSSFFFFLNKGSVFVGAIFDCSCCFQDVEAFLEYSRGSSLALRNSPQGTLFTLSYLEVMSWYPTEF